MIINDFTLPISSLRGVITGTNYCIKHRMGKVILCKRPTHKTKLKSHFPEFKELALEARRIYNNPVESEPYARIYNKVCPNYGLYQFILKELCKQFKQSKQ